MILTITLNATIDIVVPIDNMEKGKVLRTKSIYFYPGGKGTNVARALSELKAKVYATGFCGDKNFNLMDEFLKKHKVINKFIKVKGENRPCVLITETKKRNETIINSESSLIITRDNVNDFMNTTKKLTPKCKYTILSGSLPVCLPSNFYESLIRKIKLLFCLIHILPI